MVRRSPVLWGGGSGVALGDHRTCAQEAWSPFVTSDAAASRGGGGGGAFTGGEPHSVQGCEGSPWPVSQGAANVPPTADPRRCQGYGIQVIPPQRHCGGGDGTGEWGGGEGGGGLPQRPCTLGQTRMGHLRPPSPNRDGADSVGSRSEHQKWALQCGGCGWEVVGHTGFSSEGGGGVNRAPKNWGWGGLGKGSIDRHH